MAQFLCKVECKFCESEDEITVSEPDLGSVQCGDCSRKLIILSKSLIPGNNSNTSQPSRGNRMDRLLPFLAQLMGGITADGTTPIDLGDLTNDFEYEETLDEAFYQRCIKSPLTVTPQTLYTIALRINDNPLLIYPTVADFGVPLEGLIHTMMDYHTHKDSPRERRAHNTPFDFENVYSDDSESPMECLLQQSTAILADPVTGKGLTGVSFYGQITGEMKLLPQTPFPSIAIFSRGDIPFGDKAKICSDANNHQQTTTTTSPPPGSDTSKTSPLNSPQEGLHLSTMIVVDNTAIWPFTMTDKTKTAPGDILALMISRADGYSILKILQEQQAELPSAIITASISILLAKQENFGCSICMCDFDLDEEYCNLPCKHKFHPGCLEQWIKKRATCPSCRHKLPTTTPSYDDDEADRGLAPSQIQHFFG